MTAHVLTIGFRPFFFGAALVAASWLPLWLLVAGDVVHLDAHLGTTNWHAHELVFGFAGAVLSGFLLTAVRNWTRRPTPRGGMLAALFLLWLVPRLWLPWSAQAAPWLVAGIDAAFLPLVGLAIAIPIAQARNQRNAAFPVLLLALGAANLFDHARVLLGAPFPFDPVLLGVDLVIVAIAVVGGRIVPAFTRNAIRPNPVRGNDLRDRLGLWAIVAVGALHLAPELETVAGVAGVGAGALTLARLPGWGTRHTLTRPILWVLHLAWLWLGLGLISYGVALLAPEVWPTQAALHVLTVGALGHFTLGMMARVSLGHTGRPLRVPRVMAPLFLLMSAATVLRVVEPVPHRLDALPIWIAAACFSAGFLGYLVVYTPILFGPRADGRSD